MTNNEYEKECNMRTLTPYGELQIKEIDEKIARLEQSIAAEQERRREVINRHGMNKSAEFDHKRYCNHEWHETTGSISDEKYYEDYHWFCVICQKRVTQNEVIRRIDFDGCSYVYIGKNEDQHSHLCD